MTSRSQQSRLKATWTRSLLQQRISKASEHHRRFERSVMMTPSWVRVDFPVWRASSHPCAFMMRYTRFALTGAPPSAPAPAHQARGLQISVGGTRIDDLLNAMGELPVVGVPLATYEIGTLTPLDEIGPRHAHRVQFLTLRWPGSSLLKISGHGASSPTWVGRAVRNQRRRQGHG